MLLRYYNCPALLDKWAAIFCVYPLYDLQLRGILWQIESILPFGQINETVNSDDPFDTMKRKLVVNSLESLIGFNDFHDSQEPYLTSKGCLYGYGVDVMADDETSIQFELSYLGKLPRYGRVTFILNTTAETEEGLT